MVPTELPVKRGWSLAPRRLWPHISTDPFSLKALLQEPRPLEFRAKIARRLADLWGAAPLESELLRRWEYQGGSLTADPRQQA